MTLSDTLILMRRHAFASRVEAGLAACGVEEGDRVLVATSGGADSTALLLALVALASLDKWALDVHAVHVNHHLRDDAGDDAAFVAALAERLGVGHHERDIRPGDAEGNVEANGRTLRYTALAEVATQVDADHIATAHHADDQLETVLMRLVRGAGLRGMRGILPVRECHGRRVIRPMLGATHDEAVEFLRAFGEPWREDASNGDVSRARARLRAQVLPVLRSINPKAAQNAARAVDHLREVEREGHDARDAGEERGA